MAETYLYIYRNDTTRQVYVGIGENISRIWQKHNERATELLNRADTRVFVTAEPFPDRPSAERAESAAICAAAATGVAVISDRSDQDSLTNLAKVSSSRHLTKAVYTRPGTISYDDLTCTAIVTLKLESIDDMPDGSRRPTLHGGRDVEVIRERATRWWQLKAAAERRSKNADAAGNLPRDVERLLAIQKGEHVILGAWTLTDEQWRRDEGSWMFLTDQPIEEWRGQRFDWCGVQPSNAVTWSNDIKPKSLRRSR